jgi:hypothetical protein
MSTAEEPLPEVDDPTEDVHMWALSPSERRIWEAGYITGFSERQAEVDYLGNEADRYYRAAYDHRNCSCWRTQHHRS